MKTISVALGFVLFSVLAWGAERSPLPKSDVIVDFKIRMESSERDNFRRFIQAVHDGDEKTVLAYAHPAFIAALDAAGLSEIGFLRADFERLKSVEVFFSKIAREASPEYLFLYLRIETHAPSHWGATYFTQITWAKTEGGWRFLNLPLRDYTLPVGLSSLPVPLGPVKNWKEMKKED